jgi:hypothetical protein
MYLGGKEASWKKLGMVTGMEAHISWIDGEEKAAQRMELQSEQI